MCKTWIGTSDTDSKCTHIRHVQICPIEYSPNVCLRIGLIIYIFMHRIYPLHTPTCMCVFLYIRTYVFVHIHIHLCVCTHARIHSWERRRRKEETHIWYVSDVHQCIQIRHTRYVLLYSNQAWAGVYWVQRLKTNMCTPFACKYIDKYICAYMFSCHQTTRRRCIGCSEPSTKAKCLTPTTWWAICTLEDTWVSNFLEFKYLILFLCTGEKQISSVYGVIHVCVYTCSEYICNKSLTHECAPYILATHSCMQTVRRKKYKE
jgi:hypothetical protein